MSANILSIAGSDPSGGAGIQADIKAISANGGYAMAAITALTAQNTQGVSRVELTTPDMVAEQIAMIRSDIRVDAVKIGMLGSSAIVKAVEKALDGLDAPIVLDTVMVAKGGDRLLQADAVAALRDHLLPRANIITPNLPEAADLLGEDEVQDEAGMMRQATALLDLGAQAVLLKGGHLKTDRSRDLLLWQDGDEWLEAPRHLTHNTHGTGCTLSAALAAWLGRGAGMPEAVRAAKAYVTGAIAASDLLDVGRGHGPTHHFHAMWRV
ncbi:bifunctional hydroxymethylpyrimidine kinase/phosphomethylpyrimidine kinase [Roseovarius sp. 2305UL8-3]|uniref:bifunctional hydroxymethylpyrimidine kinase/phosphomethylpyrimidine kinase n=1 Tax=Roseovarius conchicola TaxID=3121636 RepID=UPI00352888BC